MRDSFNAAKAISTAAYLIQQPHHHGRGHLVGRKTEFDLTGHDFLRAANAMDEQLEVMAKLMSGAMVEHRRRIP